MANPGLTIEQMREAIYAYHRNNGNKAAAARELDLNYSTYDSRFSTAMVKAEIISADDNGVATLLTPTPAKLHISVSERPNTYGKRLRGVAIGDAHDSPRLDSKDRFRWIGRHINEIGADFVIWIGDVLTFDSLSRFDDNASLAGKFKPSFQQDIDSGHLALQAYDVGKAGHKPEIEHITLGNHEERALSFTNRTPEVAGILTGKIDNLFMSHGLTYSPYGVFYFVDAVGFTHAPLTRMGRAYSGVHALNNIGNHSLHDVVFGHRHIGGRMKCEKIGNNQSITILDIGCSLPQGYTEPYVGHSSSGWMYGIYDILIDQGRLLSDKHISMTELEELYGD